MNSANMLVSVGRIPKFLVTLWTIINAFPFVTLFVTLQ